MVDQVVMEVVEDHQVVVKGGIMYLTIKEFADSQKPPVSRKTVYEWLKADKLTYELTPSGRKRITGVKKQEANK